MDITTPTFAPIAAERPHRTVRKLAVPAAAVAGAVALSFASGIPAVVGVMTMNHNETLLSPSGEAPTAPPARRQEVAGVRRHLSALALAAVALAGPVAMTIGVSSGQGSPAEAGFGTSPGGQLNHNETLLRPDRR
jgi:hypothetical protein